jgi:hypothetical protein
MSASVRPASRGLAAGGIQQHRQRVMAGRWPDHELHQLADSLQLMRIGQRRSRFLIDRDFDHHRGDLSLRANRHHLTPVADSVQGLL